MSELSFHTQLGLSLILSVLIVFHDVNDPFLFEKLYKYTHLYFL